MYKINYIYKNRVAGGRVASKKKKYLGFILSIYLFVTVISAIFGINTKADIEPKKVYIESVLVRPGDTLWTIAKSHNSVYYPTTALYVEAIKRCNGLTSHTIKSGTYLIVPYTD